MIAQVIILGNVQPHETLFDDRLHVFDEVITMLVVYHLVCFTPFVSDLDVRYQMGYSIIGIICILLAVRLALIFSTSYQDLKKSYTASMAHHKKNVQFKDIKKKFNRDRNKRL